MLKGRVKNFDAQKGWGFIEVENEPDVLFTLMALKAAAIVS